MRGFTREREGPHVVSSVSFKQSAERSCGDECAPYPEVVLCVRACLPGHRQLEVMSEVSNGLSRRAVHVTRMEGVNVHLVDRELEAIVKRLAKKHADLDFLLSKHEVGARVGTRGGCWFAP
jgi:hypothetical protein